MPSIRSPYHIWRWGYFLDADGRPAGFDRYEALLDNLGKYKTGKSCLYVRSLDDVDMEVLQELVVESVKHMRDTYGET